MKSSDEFIPDKKPAILAVGHPKTGKTRLMLSLPTPGIIDCDNNLHSAIRVAAGKKFFVSQPMLDDTGKEVPEVDRWKKMTEEVVKMMSHPEIKSICIDGLTNLAQWGLAHAEQELIRAGINVKKEYLAKFQAFIPLLSNIITKIRLSQKIVFVTCHQTFETNDLTKAVYYSLAIPGQLKDRLGGMFTDVWGLSTQTLGDEVKYFINTRPTNVHVHLGTSYDLPPKIDVTGKSPADIWRDLEPKLSINATPTKT